MFRSVKKVGAKRSKLEDLFLKLGVLINCETEEFLQILLGFGNGFG